MKERLEEKKTYWTIVADLEWAMSRVAMVSCTCRWDEEGDPPADCQCDQRPDWVRYRQIREFLDAR